VGNHLTEETLLVEGFDCLDYLALGVVAFLHKAPEEEAHNLNYSLLGDSLTYILKKRLFTIKIIR
jgi:hypothetical protein